MKSLRVTILIAVVALMGYSSQSAEAQSWVIAGKAVSKQAAKAISKSGSKKAATSISKSATKKAATTTTTPAVGSYGAGRSVAKVPQYSKVTCSACYGRGWYLYNGYRYQCSSCYGKGYLVIRRF